jgi:hypothetical protein
MEEIRSKRVVYTLMPISIIVMEEEEVDDNLNKV